MYFANRNNGGKFVENLKTDTMNYKPFKIDSTKSHKKLAELIANCLRPVIREDYVNYTSKNVAYMVVEANSHDELIGVYNHLKFEIFFLEYYIGYGKSDMTVGLISRHLLEIKNFKRLSIR